MRVCEMSKHERPCARVPAAPAPTRRPHAVAVVTVEGPLRVPVSARLRDGVARLLDRGERWIALDLARVVGMDAAGLGELVRAYDMAKAAGGVLRVVDAPRRVRELLDLSRLWAVLAGDAADTTRARP
jgi:anti-anti-sigma factor